MNKAKTPAAGKKSQQPVSNPRRRFLITLTCIVSLLLWYVLTVFMSLGLSELVAKSEPNDMIDRLYDAMLVVQAFLPFIAGVLTAPFTVWAFRQLGLKRAAISGVTVALTPAMAIYIFILIYTLFPAILYPVNGLMLGAVFFVSCGLSVVWAGWLIKRGQAVFRGRWGVAAAVTVPLIIIGMSYLAWLLVTQ